MISYYDLGPEKRICDIVFAGAHDASITSGAINVQTQYKGRLIDQMRAGVRVFDLRMLVRKLPEGAFTVVGYHGERKDGSHTSLNYKGTDKRFPDIVTSKMSKWGGGFGERLENILNDAVEFLSKEATNEFLLLKFDKCTNYALIAEQCRHILGNLIYTVNGPKEFSQNTLDDLKGKAVCVFNDKAMAELSSLGYSPGNGILGFKNLNNDGNADQYDTKYPGLQYIGKGGTVATKVLKDAKGKMKENFETQAALMHILASIESPSAGNALGMMYWTTTGLRESIKTRDKTLWGKTGIQNMELLWNSALNEAIGTQIQNNRAEFVKYKKGRQIKAFFPNIIMIDFAKEERCKTIYALNTVAEGFLIDAVDAWEAQHGDS